MKELEECTFSPNSLQKQKTKKTSPLQQRSGGNGGHSGGNGGHRGGNGGGGHRGGNGGNGGHRGGNGGGYARASNQKPVVVVRGLGRYLEVWFNPFVFLVGWLIDCS